jgi:hypothetical protein
MTYLGWKRSELKSLWEGPKVIATADEIVFGRRPTAARAAAVDETAVSNAATATAAEIAAAADVFVDDETGDVPLLSTGTSSVTTGSSNDDGNSGFIGSNN